MRPHPRPRSREPRSAVPASARATSTYPTRSTRATMWTMQTVERWSGGASMEDTRPDRRPTDVTSSAQPNGSRMGMSRARTCTSATAPSAFSSRRGTAAMAPTVATSPGSVGSTPRPKATRCPTPIDRIERVDGSPVIDDDAGPSRRASTASFVDAALPHDARTSRSFVATRSVGGGVRPRPRRVPRAGRPPGGRRPSAA